METTRMTFTVEIKYKSYATHPLRIEWGEIPHGHPHYGSRESFPLFLKQEYNINMINGYKERLPVYSPGVIEFESEQDYILWQLHQ